MFKKLFLVLVITTFWISSVFATHLGPVVFGQERFEKVALCFSREDAIFLAKEDERSIAAGESVSQYYDKISHVMRKGNCSAFKIRYIPKETIYQWTGRMGDVQKSEKILFSLVKSEMGRHVVYVFITNKAPPPVSNLKK